MHLDDSINELIFSGVDSSRDSYGDTMMDRRGWRYLFGGVLLFERQVLIRPAVVAAATSIKIATTPRTHAGYLYISLSPVASAHQL